MASTNQTQHYNLSQYVANDKPTYLVDYNQDMAKIDAGIYSAESKALVNEGVIGDITELETTVKTDLVSAVNEVKAEADDNKDDITNLNTSVSANTGNIGVMANLQTTDKTNLVSAINEVKTETDNNATNLNNFEKLFNLVNFDEYTNQRITYTGCNRRNIKINTAFNSDYSIGKIYGFLQLNFTDYLPKVTLEGVIPSGYRPTSNITISGLMTVLNNVGNDYECQGTMIIKTNGNVDIEFSSGSNSGIAGITVHPCLLFMKDFGDTPPSNI